MIDLIKAQDEFKKYAQNYNMQLDGIDRKYFHSFRVMNLSRKIAESLNLDEEQVNLATLIGLLHDIARFEEFTRFSSFKVANKFDHGDYAIDVLKENKFIRKFIQTDKYDDIIFTAIRNHNKFDFEENLDEEKLLYCKIIKDADKIDILYEATVFFWNKEEEKESIKVSPILDSYFEQFLDNKLIFRVPNQTTIDEIVVCAAFIFDLNFKYSFEVLKSEDYINKIFARFNYENQDTIKKIETIKQVASKYINDNI